MFAGDNHVISRLDAAGEGLRRYLPEPHLGARIGPGSIMLPVLQLQLTRELKRERFCCLD